MTIESAGYIVHNNEAIVGVGSTSDWAWTNFLGELRISGVRIIDEADEGDHLGDNSLVTLARLERDNRIQAASAALIEDVATRGGAIAWRNIGGVACTRTEAGE